jgi:hypothetical protein
MKEKNGILMSKICLNVILIVLLFCTHAFADTETTADVTENSAGAETSCSPICEAYNFDPRSDIASDGGDDDDVIYWDSHGGEFSIMNDVKTFLTEEQMLAGFTMDSSIGLRDRNYIGGDPFTLQIKVTDGTTTYSDTQEYTTSAGQSYETIISQLIVPENTLVYSIATFGLILEGTSLTWGYNGPQTNSIGLTATYELPNTMDTITDIVNTAIDDMLTDTFSAIDNASMDIGISSSSGNTNLSIPITVTPTAVVLSIPTISGGVQKIEIKTQMSTPDSPQQAEQVAEIVAEVESEMEEEVESQGEEKEEGNQSQKQDKSKAVQAIVARVLQAVAMAGGDTDTTKLALMGILNNQGFKQYQQASIPDSVMYVSEIPYQSQIIDPLSSVYSLGSDMMMEEMIMQQYQ